MDEWMKERVIKMYEQEIPFSAILEVTGKDREEVCAVLGEHCSKDFNKRQKEVGLVSRKA